MSFWCRRMRGLRVLRDRGDEGFTMLIVLATMFVLTLFVTVALSAAASNLPQSRRGQDYPAAAAAAQAGIDEFVHRLNVNDTYWLNDGVDASNPAFAGYVNVPGTGTSKMTGQFTYRLLSHPADTKTTGVVRLQSTGRVNGVKRTLVANLSKPGFLKYVDFTDILIVDPLAAALLGYGSVDDLTNRCAKYYWNGRGGGCPEVYWGPSDVENGPVHTNDAPLLGGNPLFTSPTTETSWPDTGNPAPPLPNRYRQQWGGSAPSSSGYTFQYAPLQTMPPTNSALVSVAQSGGCLYTGPTKIVLNAGGTMTVLSPSTRSINPGCYDTSDAARNTAQTVALPANGVVYVQDIPTSGPNSDPGLVCPSQELGQYPQANDAMTYDCHVGDLFVEGTLKGQLTMAASNNIIATNNIRYAGGRNGNDVLGLIANNSVEIYHPVNCGGSSCGAMSGTNLPVANGAPLTNVEIDAAILSLEHCFTVQNWQAGAKLGTRTVFGSVAEKYGAVSSYGGYTGYDDNFVYDQRLPALPPPYFLKPTAAAWQPVKLSEQTPS